MLWQKEGLNIPNEVTTATALYREEMDILGAFLSDRCVISWVAQVATKALYNDYESWCESNGEKPISKRAFGMRLVERGFERAKSGNKRLWKGVGLAAEPSL